MVKIQEITVNNLYSFGGQQKLKLSDINHVVGTNNSGKTNILRVLRLVTTTIHPPVERLRLSDRYVGLRKDSRLDLKLSFNEEERKLIFDLLCFPRSKEEAKTSVDDVAQEIILDLGKAELTLYWRYDGLIEGTYTRTRLLFPDLGIALIDFEGNRRLQYHSSDDISKLIAMEGAEEGEES